MNSTPLESFHLARNAKMVSFAGWSLPLQYAGQGIIAEHKQTRQEASLFDVSHMCQMKVTGEGRQDAIDRILPITSSKLALGRNKYSFACNPSGGILDDLLIGNDGDELFIICNAARAEVIQEHLRAELGSGSELHCVTDRALLAVQGPQAVNVVSAIFPQAQDLYFMDSCHVEFAGHDCRICRSGYTGEDGYEISVPAAVACELAEKIVSDTCKPAGLGARDTLRLEACLCLYGQDISEDVNPVEAGLLWAIPPSARKAARFIGAQEVMALVSEGSKRRLVALAVSGRSAVRSGVELSVAGGGQVGIVTSGAFSPTLEKPIALALVETEHSEEDMQLVANLRGKDVNCNVVKMPFVPHKYLVRPRKK